MKKFRKMAFAVLAAGLLFQSSTVFAETEITADAEDFQLNLCNATGELQELVSGEEAQTYQAGDTVVSFLGDSVTTYLGYTQYNEGGNYYSENIMTADQTWWMSLLEEEGWSLGVNESLGGSRVTWDGKTDDSYYHLGPDYYLASDARINMLGENGTPDKIFVFGGLNDILSQGEVEIGTYSDELAYGKVDTFADAYYTMITKIKTTYPDAEIICIIPYDTIYSLSSSQIAQDNAKASDVIKGICNEYGLKWIDLKRAGIEAQTDLLNTKDNAQVSDDYIHPNVSGMAKIKDYVVKELNREPGLVEEDGLIYYYDENSNMVSESFEEIDGDTYYFQADGTAMVNKRSYDETGKYRIYFDENGRMVENQIVKDKQSGKSWYFDVDGHQVMNQYVRIDDKAYYFDKNGDMYTKTSYVDEKGDVRYFRSDGTMIYNDYYCDGVYTYYLQYDGTPMKDRLTYDPEGTGLIYFNEKGHMLFDTFQYCKDVKYTCYFATDGRAYFDQVTFVGDKAYYLNACGKMEDSGWFQFANGVDYGYANPDGTLHTEGFSYDPLGRVVFFYWNGMVARGLITDGVWYYNMDMTDGHYLGQFR